MTKKTEQSRRNWLLTTVKLVDFLRSVLLHISLALQLSKQKIHNCGNTRRPLSLDQAAVNASYMKQLSTQKEEFILSRARIASALAFSQQLLSLASSTDLATTSKLVTEQFETLSILPSDKTLVRKSQWSMVLSSFNPLRSKAVDTSLVDNLLVTMPRFDQLGSNDFLLYPQASC